MTRWMGLGTNCICEGQVVGASTRHGGEVKDRPVSPLDVWATVYTALGIAPQTLLHNEQNRPIPILTDGQPMADLLA